MLDRPHIPNSGPHTGLTAVLPPAAPVSELVCGRPVEEVAELIPRVFNLCRASQSAAVRLALGLPVLAGDDLNADIARDHAMRLGVYLPLRMGLPPLSLGGAKGADLVNALFGRSCFCETPEAFREFVKTDAGIAPLLRGLIERFAPGEGSAPGLAAPSTTTVLLPIALENTVAARQSAHPVMRDIEMHFGRGPLWRCVARALDFQMASSSNLPQPRLIGQGTALVPASRGQYAVQAEVVQGRVTAFRRVTPTDHLLAPDGIMARSLASLPQQKHHEAELLVDLLDPCSPVTLKGAQNA